MTARFSRLHGIRISPEDWTVKTFDRLIPIGAAFRIAKLTLVVCECSCGNVVLVQCHSIVKGTTGSCGCRHKDRTSQAKFKHGKCDLPEYRIWSGIKTRCTNENESCYQNYGGRGISMCERWLNSFQSFYKDMGPRPTPLHEIDRENNDLGYFPENCRWTDGVTQANNTRSNRRVTIDGETRTIAQWARFANMKYAKLYARIEKGMDPKSAILFTGKLSNKPNSMSVVPDFSNVKLPLHLLSDPQS